MRQHEAPSGRIDCVICGGELSLSSEMSVDHECGHWSHISCHGEYGDFECVKCVPTANAIKNMPVLKEVATPIDYISKPLEPTRLNNLRTTALRAVAQWGSQNRHEEDVDNPFYWLNKGVSLEWIIRNKDGAGLQYMLSKGVQLDDFLANRYTLGDLLIYEDFNKTPSRARDALYALGTTADHLIDNQGALPIETLVGERFELRPRHMVERMGIGFHPTEGLRTPRTDAWQVENVIYLGFSFTDLKKSGMTTRELWDDLEVTSDEMNALGATQAMVNALPYAVLEVYDDDDDDAPLVQGDNYEQRQQLPHQQQQQYTSQRPQGRGPVGHRANAVSKRHFGFRAPRHK